MTRTKAGPPLSNRRATGRHSTWRQRAMSTPAEARSVACASVLDFKSGSRRRELPASRMVPPRVTASAALQVPEEIPRFSLKPGPPSSLRRTAPRRRLAIVALELDVSVLDRAADAAALLEAPGQGAQAIVVEQDIGDGRGGLTVAAGDLAVHVHAAANACRTASAPRTSPLGR